eukprot:5722078-Ditylum_brightwellii.AAC.1
MVLSQKTTSQKKMTIGQKGCHLKVCSVLKGVLIKDQNQSDDVNETNKLGKSDGKIDGGDKSNGDYVGGDKGSRKSSLEGPTDKEDHQGDEEMSNADGSLVLSMSESTNKNETNQDRE